MIVQDAGDSLLVITQPDHAALAADLMAGWREDGLPERPTREVVLYATRHHDIGWTEPDAAPLANPATGRPYDFISAPDDVKQQVWPHAIGRLSTQSTYAAALVAQHALTIFKRFRDRSAWSSFFGVMEGERDRWLATDVRPDGSTGGPPDAPLADRRDFPRDYMVVSIGDLLSLTFCNAWRTEQTAGRYSIVLRGSTLAVAPDPFGREIAFTVRARRIPNRVYREDDDLRGTLGRAPEEWLEGTAVGVPVLPRGESA